MTSRPDEPAVEVAPVASPLTMAAELVGPDGLTDWQRNRIAEQVRYFHQRLKPIKPMVSIRNLSPAFLRMAINLDVRLCEYRDKEGQATVIFWSMRCNGIPNTIIDVDGRKIGNPELDRINEITREAWDATFKVIDEINGTKAITGGDKTLKKRTGDLRCCNWLRQLDMLHSVWSDGRIDAGPRASGHPTA